MIVGNGRKIGEGILGLLFSGVVIYLGSAVVDTHNQITSVGSGAIMGGLVGVLVSGFFIYRGITE